MIRRRLATAFCLLVCSNASAWDARLNFLFILVDNQSPFDFKACNPSSRLRSPNIDRLVPQISNRLFLWNDVAFRKCPT